MANDLGKTSTGIQPNVAALLSYVLGVITGIIFFIIEKENKCYIGDRKYTFNKKNKILRHTLKK